MTKVKMPEPVAYFYQRDFDKYKASYPGGIPVITTTQAEAYANQRVKQALEEAITEVMRCKTSGIIRNGTVDKCADAIRAMIPKEPPCET